MNPKIPLVNLWGGPAPHVGNAFFNFIFSHFCCSEKTAFVFVWELWYQVLGGRADLEGTVVTTIVLKPESMWQMSNKAAVAVLKLDIETLQGIYCVIIMDLWLQQSRWPSNQPVTRGNSWWHIEVFVIRQLECCRGLWQVRHCRNHGLDATPVPVWPSKLGARCC